MRAAGLREAIPAPIDDRLDLVPRTGHQRRVHAEPGHVGELPVDLVMVLADLGDRRAAADHRHDALVRVDEVLSLLARRTRRGCSPPPTCRSEGRRSRAVEAPHPSGPGMLAMSPIT